MALKPRGLLALAVLVVVAVAVSAGTLLAADPQPQAAKPTAVIKVVPVAASAADPNVIEATLADGKTKVQSGTPGLPNVSVGVPVTLKGAASDPALTITKYTWTFTKPAASKSELKPNNEPIAKFTPDVSGVYKVDLLVSNEAGSSNMASMQIRAGEYIGAGVGNCFQCHSTTTQEWSETGHATKVKREINGGANPASSSYSEYCLRCHATGYYPGADNGGFADVQADLGWQFPDKSVVQAGKGWETMPEILQNVANIQCETCHGPARDHVANSSIEPAVSLDNGVCNQCHNAGKSLKGTAVANSKHGDATSQAWTYPTGPSRQACVRCHSGAGFISLLANPKEMASWDNTPQTPGCSTCHDPHSDANKFQLRVVGQAVEAAGVTKDFGLSATCATCHNARTLPQDAQKGSYPHYSAGAEMLSNSGGVAYGQEVPNSPHGLVVGVAPVKDPTDKEGQRMLFGGAIPGPCVTCHMAPNGLAADDPNRWKVGGHNFAMSSPDGKVQNTTACQTCHAGITSFDLPAKADYDGNGQVEGVQEEVAGLVRLLQKAIADSGIKPVQGNPYFDRDDLAKANEKQKNAIYNYRFVRGLEGRDGKDNAIHNFKRSVALLQLSYKDLTGQDVPNATLMK